MSEQDFNERLEEERRYQERVERSNRRRDVAAGIAMVAVWVFVWVVLPILSSL